MRHTAILAIIICVAVLSVFGCSRRLDGPHGPNKHDRHYMEPSDPDSHAERGLLDPNYITAEFPGKIVYTTERNVDVRALRRDCSRRGGYFNECGSPCAEGAICAEVCAYTCEFR